MSLASSLQLPLRLRLDDAHHAWATLQAALRAEAAQVLAAAGRELSLSGSALQDFDSSALSVMLSAARLVQGLGLQLRLDEINPRLRELARVYGVAELLWPPAPAPAGGGG